MLGWVGLGWVRLQSQIRQSPVCRPGGLLDSTRPGGRAAGIRLFVLNDE